MILENKNDELIIRVSSKEANLAEIERLLKFIRYKELVSYSNGSDEDADIIAEEINQSYWNKSKTSFNK